MGGGGVTHDVSGGEDPVDDGAAEGGDHSETDEDDGRHQLGRENNVTWCAGETAMDSVCLASSV